MIIGAVNNCKFPQNPFPGINPSNPVSWYEGTSNFVSGLLGTKACLESDSTAGILGAPGYNPQENIHNQFKVAALLGKMFDLFKWIVELFKQQLQAEKDIQSLALPAK